MVKVVKLEQASKDVIKSPSLEVSKNRLDMHLLGMV